MTRQKSGMSRLMAPALAAALLIVGAAVAVAQQPMQDLPPLPERVKIHETLRLLSALGYDARVDEALKIDIAGAIRQFQRDHALPVDGKMTDETLAALHEASK